MNIPRYSFSENINNDLMYYLKVTNEVKSDKYCDFKNYEQFKRLFPIPKEIKERFKTYTENMNVCIDITHSDDDTEHKSNVSLYKVEERNIYQNDVDINSILSDTSPKLNNVTNIEDIVDSIKDSLTIHTVVPISVIEELSNLSNDTLDKLFSSLMDQLTLEDVVNFWNSLMELNNINDHVILCYTRFLFTKRVKEQFTFELQNIFSSLCEKYSTIIKHELVKGLLETGEMENESNRILQQYIGTLNRDYQKDILELLLSSCEKLRPNYISTIEALLNPQCNEDILRKTVEIMSNAAMEFSTDNSYGKLLYNVVNLLERNVCQLEQPLKHILGIHKSIWKIKVQKVFVSWFDDSLTQSFV